MNITGLTSAQIATLKALGAVETWQFKRHGLQGDFLQALFASDNECRLWQGQGKRVAAHQLLAAIYGWFTEGFNTVDLKATQALLDEL